MTLEDAQRAFSHTAVPVIHDLTQHLPVTLYALLKWLPDINTHLCNTP
jgi:hypothetical protein